VHELVVGASLQIVAIDNKPMLLKAQSPKVLALRLAEAKVI
jgi:hypothetical protein